MEQTTHYWDWDYQDPSHCLFVDKRLYSKDCEPLSSEELEYWLSRSGGFNHGKSKINGNSGYETPLGSRFGDLELIAYLPPTTFYEQRIGRWRAVPVGRWKCHHCGIIIDKVINRVTGKPSGRASKIKNCGCRNPYRKQGVEIERCQVPLPILSADVDIEALEELKKRKNANRINGVPIGVINAGRTKIPIGRTFEEAIERNENRRVRTYETVTDVRASKIRFDPSTRYNTPHHKLTEMPEYLRWNGMHARCENPNAQEYHNYGARGITVCEEWSKHREDGMGFINYLDWLNSAGYFDIPYEERPMWQIDREENNDGYSPKNCHIVPPSVNARNTRSNLYIPDMLPDGKVVMMIWADFTDHYGLDRNYLLTKVESGWSLNAILFAVHHKDILILHRKKGAYYSEYKDQPGVWYYQLIPNVVPKDRLDEWNEMLRLREERNRQYRENRNNYR